MRKASAPGVAHPSEELIRQELNAILASETFRNAPRLSRFLRYVVEESLRDNADRLKEYQIGVDVFGRKPDYDTRTDPVVRVEARQLRFKLAEYYARFGAGEQVIISLPKGGYAAHFEWRTGQPTAEPLTAEPFSPGVERDPRIPVKHRFTGKFIALAVALAVVIVGAITVDARRGRESHASQTATAEARELYLKGRYYWNKRTPEALNQAVDLFTQAMVKDPGYAPAYVGLADTYNLLSEYTPMPQAEAFSRALAAAEKAVELDDRSVEAHTSLAFALFWGAWNPAAAEREYKRAIELNPNYVIAHHWYATMLSGLGRPDEAIREIERARELDPSSTAVVADEGAILLAAGKREEARALLKQLEQSDPSFISTHRYLAVLYLTDGEFEAYLKEFRQHAELSHDQEELDLTSAGEEGFKSNGPHGMLKAMQQVEQRYASPQRPRNYEFAEICMLLGEKQKALDYLHAAVQARESAVLVLASAADLAPLHNDARWPELLNEVRASAHAEPRT